MFGMICDATLLHVPHTERLFACQAGILLTMVPAENHHQLGRIERHNAAWRGEASRVIDSSGASSAEGVDTVVSAVYHAKNSLCRQFGHSPCQACFGRGPRVAA